MTTEKLRDAETVELVVAAIANPGALVERGEEYRTVARWSAEAVLVALAAAGRLQSPVVHEETEYGEECEAIECPLPHNRCCWDPDAGHRHTHSRPIRELADGSQLVGPWVSVNEGSETT